MFHPHPTRAIVIPRNWVFNACQYPGAGGAPVTPRPGDPTNPLLSHHLDLAISGPSHLLFKNLAIPPSRPLSTTASPFPHHHIQHVSAVEPKACLPSPRGLSQSAASRVAAVGLDAAAQPRSADRPDCQIEARVCDQVQSVPCRRVARGPETDQGLQYQRL